MVFMFRAVRFLIQRPSLIPQIPYHGFASARGGARGPPTVSFRLMDTISKVHTETGKIRIFVSGIIPYGPSCVGHARTFIVFDTLFRYLKYLGYNVSYVRTVNDVDERICKLAKELKEDELSLATRYYNDFISDMADLRCLPPTHEPRISNHIKEINNMIDNIQAAGYLYFDTKAVHFKMRRSLIDHILRSVNKEIIDCRSQVQYFNVIRDFVLWETAEKGEKGWKGTGDRKRGRPGPNIGNTAICYKYFGHSVDIYGGFIDQLLPHHVRDMAQAWAAYDGCHVRSWMHCGVVRVENRDLSMYHCSTIRELLDSYDEFSVRYFFLSTYYRDPISYTKKRLGGAVGSIFYIFSTLEEVDIFLKGQDVPLAKDDMSISSEDFINMPLIGHLRRCMSDDLHTEHVLKNDFSTPLHILETSLEDSKIGFDVDIKTVVDIRRELRHVLGVLGLLPQCCSEALQKLREKTLKRAHLTESELLELIRLRNSSKRRDAKTDPIRDELESRGITISKGYDSATTWGPRIYTPNELI